MDEDRLKPARVRNTRRSNSGPTVSDVARRSGVSLMTVSRVINRENNVLPATREKVQSAIVELGYVPNFAARSLAGGRQCRIALLYSNPSAAYLSELLIGSLDGAARNDAQLAIEHWNGSEDAKAIARRFAAHRIDAVLLPPPLCEHIPLLQALDKARIPVVQVASGQPSTNAHAVSISDHAAAKAMTTFLIEQGHRRIGFIAGSSNQSASELRLDGYRAALADADLPVHRDLVAQGDYTYRSGLNAADRLLSLPTPPTAIFASNDDMAAAVLSVAHRRQLDVPRDLSMCGFDDTSMATNVWPELTTVHQPIADMARVATGILAEVLRGLPTGEAMPAHHHQVTYALVERGSTARARAPD